jgi:hypothetical protein
VGELLHRRGNVAVLALKKARLLRQGQIEEALGLLPRRDLENRLFDVAYWESRGRMTDQLGNFP